VATFSLSSKRLKQITGGFTNTKIMVVGDIMLDEYIWGSVDRISPEAPVPVLAVDEESTRLGGAANVVQNLSKAGVTPVLVSVCGNDIYGARLHKQLEENRCSTNYILKSKARHTTVKTRIMARQQQIVRVDREACRDLDANETRKMVANFTRALSGVDGVIISDYAKGVVCPALLKEVISLCNKQKKYVAVDPKERHFNLYKGVTVITPNLREAHAILGIPYNRRIADTEIEGLGWRIVEKLDLSYLLLTLSERGMAIFEKKDKRFNRLPTVAKHVYDVTGAGDTVISIFSAAIICSATPLEAAFLSNHAAGITVTEIGTASVDVDTLIKACRAGM